MPGDMKAKIADTLNEILKHKELDKITVNGTGRRLQYQSAIFFHLPLFRTLWRSWSGINDQALKQSIEKSRQVHPVNFIFALCIPLIGVDAGKKIIAAIGFEGFLQRLHQGDGFEDIEGIGAERSRSIVTWYQNEKNHSGFEDLLHELSIEHVEVQDTSSGSCAGLSFVITGDVHHYKTGMN